MGDSEDFHWEVDFDLGLDLDLDLGFDLDFGLDFGLDFDTALGLLCLPLFLFIYLISFKCFFISTACFLYYSISSLLVCDSAYFLYYLILSFLVLRSQLFSLLSNVFFLSFEIPDGTPCYVWYFGGHLVPLSFCCIFSVLINYFLI